MAGDIIAFEKKKKKKKLGDVMFDDIMAPVQSTAWIQNDTYSLLRKDAVFKRRGG